MGLQDMSLDQLENEITELAGHINAATCRWLLLVGELDRREGWLEWGCKSCAHWLSLRCGIGLTAARQQVKVARALPQLPQIRGSFSRGELSYRRCARSLPRGHPGHRGGPARGGTACHGRAARGPRALVPRRPGARARPGERRLPESFRHLLPRGRRLAGAERPAASGGGARPRRPGSGDGFVPRRCRRRFRGIVCAPSAIKADGLVRMAETVLASGPTPVSGGSRQELVVHVDAATLAGDEDGACHVDAGPAPHPETARRLGCDSSVVRTRARRQAAIRGPQDASRPAGPRGPLRSRDGGCRFPRLHRATIRGRPSHPALGPRRPERARELGPARRRHHRLLHEGGYTWNAVLADSSSEGLEPWPIRSGRRLRGDQRQPATEPRVEPLRDRHSAPVRGQVRSRVRGRRDRGSGFALRRRRSCPTRRDRRQPREASPAEAWNFPPFADIHLPDPGRQA